MKSVFHVEQYDRQIDSKTMVDTAKKIYTSAGNKIKDITSLDVYVNASEAKVYFVVNAGAETEFRGDFEF